MRGLAWGVVFLALLIWIGSASAKNAMQGEQLGPHLPDAQFRPAVPKKNTKNRKALLENLYERLEAAESTENAQLIAEAIEKLWMQSGSDTINLLIKRADQLVQKSDLDTAIRILDRVVHLAPQYSEGWNRRATVYFLQNKFEDSLGDIRRVLALDPRHFQAINGLGLIMRELGDKKAALKAYRKVLEVYPFLDSARQTEKELAREVEGQGI